MQIGGYLVFVRGGVHEEFFGIKSSAAPEWSVCEPHPRIYVCDFNIFLAGEVCRDWQPWGEYWGIGSILGQSLLQSIAYILLSVRAYLPLCEMCSHFYPSLDSLRVKRRRPRNLICPIVSPASANAFDSLLECERQRFPHRK